MTMIRLILEEHMRQETKYLLNWNNSIVRQAQENVGVHWQEKTNNRRRAVQHSKKMEYIKRLYTNYGAEK